jgi:hypothetical protein
MNIYCSDSSEIGETLSGGGGWRTRSELSKNQTPLRAASMRHLGEKTAQKAAKKKQLHRPSGRITRFNDEHAMCEFHPSLFWCVEHFARRGASASARATIATHAAALTRGVHHHTAGLIRRDES